MKKTLDTVTGLLFFATVGFAVLMIWIPEVFMLFLD